jgi:hypothetical protein
MELSRQNPRTEEIFGDRSVRSDHPIARQLTILVGEIGIGWATPFSERDCEMAPGGSWTGR